MCVCVSQMKSKYLPCNVTIQWHRNNNRIIPKKWPKHASSPEHIVNMSGNSYSYCFSAEAYDMANWPTGQRADGPSGHRLSNWQLASRTRTGEPRALIYRQLICTPLLVFSWPFINYALIGGNQSVFILDALTERLEMWGRKRKSYELFFEQLKD